LLLRSNISASVGDFSCLKIGCKFMFRRCVYVCVCVLGSRVIIEWKPSVAVAALTAKAAGDWSIYRAMVSAWSFVLCGPVWPGAGDHRPRHSSPPARPAGHRRGRPPMIDCLAPLSSMNRCFCTLHLVLAF